MRRLLLLTLMLAAVSNTARAAEPIDVEAYGKCTVAGRERVSPAAVMAACKGLAEKGVPAAQYLIGITFLNANGVKSPEAAEWLTRAAATGHPPAQDALAVIRLSSNDEADRAAGRELMRKSACNGFPQALQFMEKIKVAREQLQCDDSPTNFNGTWHTSLTAIKIPPTGTPKFNFRITIENETAKVFYETDGKWSESKPGKFHLAREGQTVVVSTIDSGWDFDGQWIETWTFQLLRTGNKTAFVNFVRTVNNPHLPDTLEWRTFTAVAEGSASRD